MAQLDKPDDDLLLMESWINDCVANHPDCATTIESFQLSRLLDLKHFDASPDIALVSKKDFPLEGVAYTALSHCWGCSTKRPPKTTRANLADRSERISFDELSLTFQDAAEITRSLGVRYLWIDFLCIIQDMHQDWEREAAMMGQVYAHSICTLAASSSADSYGGCRVNARKMTTNKPARRLDISVGIERIRIFEHSPLDWNKEYDSNALRTRAWTLQEWELSTRSVHFSQNMLLWECKTIKASSELPWHQMKIEDPPPTLLYNELAEATGENTASLPLREHWFRVVEDYSGRYLTYESDKLPAISGLAQKCQGPRGRYVAGLWEKDMPSALLWQMESPSLISDPQAYKPRRPAGYRGPTWSWASVDGNISYHSQKRQLPRAQDKASKLELDFGNFKVNRVVIHAAGEDSMGAVSDGYLCVKGCLSTAIFHGESHKGTTSTYDEGWRALSTPDGVTIGAAYIDVLSELSDGQAVFCLSVRKEIYWTMRDMPYHLYNGNSKAEDEEGWEAMIMGLILIGSNERAGSYRRVGLVRWMKESCFVDVEPSEITII